MIVMYLPSSMLNNINQSTPNNLIINNKTFLIFNLLIKYNLFRLIQLLAFSVGVISNTSDSYLLLILTFSLLWFFLIF